MCAPKHNGHFANNDILFREHLVIESEFNVDVNVARVIEIRDTAFLGMELEGLEVFFDGWHADSDTVILEVEAALYVREDAVVRLRLDDLLHVMVDELVERVDVVLHQALQVDEPFDQFLLLLDVLDWLSQLFPCEKRWICSEI